MVSRPNRTALALGLWIGALGIFCALGWVLRRDAAPDSARIEVPSGLTEEAPEDAARLAEGRSQAAESPQLQPGARARPADVQPPTQASERELESMQGRVVDLHGAPVAGVALGFTVGQEPRTHSDAAGAFRLRAKADRRVLQSVDRQWATVRGARMNPGESERERVIVVAEPLDVAGTVVDGDDRALAGARIALDVPLMCFARIRVPLDSTVALEPSTTSDGSGRFRLENLPAVAGAVLAAELDGYRALEEPLPARSIEDLRLVLVPLTAEGPAVYGDVAFEDGTPATGALVGLGGFQTKSDARGRFELGVAWADEAMPLYAVLAGHRPARIASFGARMTSDHGAVGPVHLVLGGAPLSIAGRVLDAQGEPCKGWSVGAVDPTILTPHQVPPLTAEGLASPSGGLVDATDREGRFELAGLDDRTYRLQAWNRRSLVRVRSEPISAGTRDVELRVPAGALRERLRGRVVSPRGDGISGVQVTVILPTVESESGSSWIEGGRARTDGDGRFEIAQVARQGTKLSLEGDAVMPVQRSLDPALDEVVVVASRRCHFQIERASGAEEAGATEPTADSIGLLDGLGQPLQVFSVQEGMWSSYSRYQVPPGGSPVLSASEEAATIVLYRANAEIERRAIELVPGQTLAIRP